MTAVAPGRLVSFPVRDANRFLFMNNEDVKTVLTRIATKIKMRLGWDAFKIKTWLKTPNPNFGGVTPARMVSMGRGHKVVQFVEFALEDNEQ